MRRTVLVWWAAAGCLPDEQGVPGRLLVDADGDGVLASKDCDDDDPAVTDRVYRDDDGDGYGGAEAPRPDRPCDAGPGTATMGGDCDDDPETGGDIHPGAAEVCNGLDDDCDGAEDDDDPDVQGQDRWCRDADGDRVGDGVDCLMACKYDGSDRVQVDEGDPDDCDDGDASVFPGADDVACDGVDSDCDGQDAGSGAVLYLDVDGDGFGSVPVPDACPGRPYAAVGGDCDDDDPREVPGGTERCDGLDDDCDGVIDNVVENQVWYQDQDGDGRGLPDVAHPTAKTCQTPVGGWSLLPYDCDDADPFDPWRLSYDDSDGDGVGDTALPTLACDQVPESSFGDCDPSSPARWLAMDQCDTAETAFCGSPETDCPSATSVTWSGWTGGVVAWSSRPGDWDGDGQPDVAVGTYDTAFEDQALRPDEVVVWMGDGVDLAGQDWPGDAIRLRLPLDAGAPDPLVANLGTTQAVFGDFDDSPGDELAIVVVDGDNNRTGSVWIVSDPPAQSTVDLDAADPNVHRIDLPHGPYDPYASTFLEPHQRLGYAVMAADVDGDGSDDLVMASPAFGYEDDSTWVVFGNPSGPITAADLDDPTVGVLVDDGVFADGLGCDAAFSPTFGGGGGAVALTALGSRSDPAAVLVFPADTWRAGGRASVQSTFHAWYRFTGFGTPGSHHSAPRAVWGEVGGDPAKSDLVATVTDDVRARAYVFFDVEEDAGVSDEADRTAELVLDLPFSDCIDVALVGTTLLVACPSSPYERTPSDPGLVLTIDLAALATGRVPLPVTTDLSDQIAAQPPYQGLARPVGIPGTTSVIFDHATYAPTEGFSIVTMP